MSLSQILLLLVAVGTGMLIPLQPGINAELRLHSGSALTAALISFAGGTLVIALTLIAVRVLQASEPTPVRVWVAEAPWWAYAGGVIGAMFVTVSLVLAPKLGAAVLVAGIVTGQLVGSVVVDHFGFVGFPRTAVTWPRVIGVGLLILGVIVMQFGRSGSGEQTDHGSSRVYTDTAAADH